MAADTISRWQLTEHESHCGVSRTQTKEQKHGGGGSHSRHKETLILTEPGVLGPCSAGTPRWKAPRHTQWGAQPAAGPSLSLLLKDVNTSPARRFRNGLAAPAVPNPGRAHVIPAPALEKCRSPQGPLAQFWRSPTPPPPRSVLLLSCSPLHQLYFSSFCPTPEPRTGPASAASVQAGPRTSSNESTTGVPNA